jgi:large subunit ribosomal protein L35
MPKQKTNRASAKRFNFTKTGKVKRKRAFKSHHLKSGKTPKRVRQLRKGAYTTVTEAKIIRKLVPYK